MFNKIRRFFDANRFHNAIKMADNKFQKTGERQYILLQTDGQFVVMNRQIFRQMKKEGRLPSNVDILTLERDCLYHTPYANGSGACSKEKLADSLERYLRWCKLDREQKKYIKRQQKLARKAKK
jgi:hypothetical protein